jgi:hypothetical protein
MGHELTRAEAQAHLRALYDRMEANSARPGPAHEFLKELCERRRNRLRAVLRDDEPLDAKRHPW